MSKLFNVVADMEEMNASQLRGAIRNMESISNTMYAAFNELVKEYSSDHYDNVLDLSFDSFDGVNEFYLPAINGGMVIINEKRLDSLLRWKLEFFAKYGNLRLDANYSKNNTVYLSLDYTEKLTVGYQLWHDARTELERSSAALYESMSKTKF